MRRVHIEPRPNASRLVQSQGLVHNEDPFPDDQHELYWPEDRYYAFTTEEINLLERASREVFEMLCEAAEHLVDNPHLITERMAIPAFCVRQIVDSWDREPAFGSVYSRFDVCFGGLDHPDPRLRVPKFYEFNADTPTSLLEGSSVQWYWLEQTGHGPDQFNSIEEALVQAWKRNLAEVEKKLGHRPKVIHFASLGDYSGEDEVNTEVLAATCAEAGYAVRRIWVDQIGLGSDGRFYDGTDGEHIDVIFKLYPWETMVMEKFGEACFADMDNVGKRDEETGEYVGGTIWFEAPYKLLWSNKAIFALLWELFKDDPRSQWLLPTYLEPEMPADMKQYARKPIFAREGSGVTLRKDDGTIISESDADGYGDEGYVVQELALLPRFPDDRTGKIFYPVLGMWMVDGEPVGMGIREDIDPVTSNCSTFVPHVIEDGKLSYERKPVPTLEEIEAALSIETYQNPALLGDDKARGVLPYIDSVVTAVA
ncbi:hypothetical protein MAPG_00189 [Magnaporthiopsis poae ATCC 64411]|uniref:Glutathionylspermidine synthase pre-ATP-grasp-like domain-containing protein n=1 Tax=Magnaporthiopsis poae (strain ATCC 64411 / 73-15) TaxID=644358 RepID=A0A0C4DKC1_MAGP6|nr:hypothetical protein MAPG_00189 [Magnaporthiopsis poae ATCC 64411]